MECVHEAWNRCRSVSSLLGVSGGRGGSIRDVLFYSKATNRTTDSAIMDELRDMKNNFRG